MKIKEICKQTGLTDRTVRFYIEEGLISPFYTENYLGRKSFEFSQQDLKALKSIATLRAYGFTVEEIKLLLSDEADSRSIVEAVKKRTEENLDENKRRYAVLSELGTAEGLGVEALAERLSDTDCAVKNESAGVSGKRFFTWMKSCLVFLAVWLPIVLSVSVLLFRLCGLDAPVVRPIFFIGTLLCFVPSMVTVFFSRHLKGTRRGIRLVLVGFCVICLPLGAQLSAKSVVVCEHRYEAYRTTVEATCQNGGEVLLACKSCGNLKAQSTEKRPHTAVTVQGRAPTCLASGISDGSVCASCGMVLKAQEALPKSEEHTPVIDAAAPESCIKAGLTEGSHCAVCNITLVAQEAIAARGHRYKAQIIEQTCGTDGCILYTCDCGKSYKTDVVRASNAHDFQAKSGGDGYICRTCELEVVAFGTVDGSSPAALGAIQFYITGSRKMSQRALVIYGQGDMPDFEDGHEPAWINEYLYQVRTIIIESGVTSVGENAFSNSDYRDVRELIIRSEDIRYEEHLPAWFGINILFTRIIYEN